MCKRASCPSPPPTAGSRPAVVTAAYALDAAAPLELPLLALPCPAGFPSPAEEYIEGERLDLNEHLIRHPAATFVVRVRGDSMRGAGIESGDYLIVDRSLEPADGKVVVAVVDGELTLKRLRLAGRRARGLSDNRDPRRDRAADLGRCDLRDPSAVIGERCKGEGRPLARDRPLC